MRIVRDVNKFPPFRRGCCLTIGTFDGVHLGHQEVIREVSRSAVASGLTSAVMTFDPHPRSSLGKGFAPRLLTSTDHKLALIGELGIDVCVLVELDDNLASMSATDFVTEMLHDKLRVAGMVVGPRLRFGRDRRGTPSLLKRLGEKLGFWLEVVGEVLLDGTPVSSTIVRRSVLEGNLSRVESLLGRRFSVVGRVVRGRTIGRKLGYRTANVNPLDEVIPPNGVYAVEVAVNGEKHSGALYVGSRPTFSSEEFSVPVLEAHILDFNEPIYRKRVEVVFHSRIRDEQRFATCEELAAQIALDIDEVKRYFQQMRSAGLSQKTMPATIMPSRSTEILD